MVDPSADNETGDHGIRSRLRGHVPSSKGGRLRYVAMTTRLAQASRNHRHLRGGNVLCQDDERPLTRHIEARDNPHLPGIWASWLQPEANQISLLDVPLTRRLAAALAEHRHLRSPRVLCQDDNEPLTRQIVQTRVKRASRMAGLQHTRACPAAHVLFAPGDAWCTRTGDSGARRHQDLSVTQRYMHLRPVGLDDAIRLLDQPVRRRPASAANPGCGDMLETGVGQQK